ncbi:MAG: di-heme oxidoredictase family protein [Planctomycetota bacterium]
MPCLPLDERGWIYREPNPFNPSGNLRLSDPYVATHGVFRVDLTSDELPQPRLAPEHGVVNVPAFTDLKLHDITSGDTDPNREPLNMQWPPSDPRFFQGNKRFLTRKLWGCANEPPFFHHGQYTTLRQAVEAHAGEAIAARTAFDGLSKYERDSIIEFLKTLRVLPPDTRSLVVDENGDPKEWQAFPCGCGG